MIRAPQPAKSSLILTSMWRIFQTFSCSLCPLSGIRLWSSSCSPTQSWDSLCPRPWVCSVWWLLFSSCSPCKVCAVSPPPPAMTTLCISRRPQRVVCWCHDSCTFSRFLLWKGDRRNRTCIVKMYSITELKYMFHYLKWVCFFVQVKMGMFLFPLCKKKVLAAVHCVLETKDVNCA